MLKNANYIPKAVFDTFEATIELYKEVTGSNNPKSVIQDWFKVCFAANNTKTKTPTAPLSVPDFAINDYKLALSFLYSYRGSVDTFGAYRRDLERFLQWSWFICQKSILDHRREDIEAFIEFCMKPPKSWIALKKVARFKTNKDSTKISNPEWKPFEAHISKSDHREGNKPSKKEYKFSGAAMKAMFGILSSFYNFLMQEEIAQINPVILIRQKSKFLQKQQKVQVVRRLSNQEWESVISFIKAKAEEDINHERTLFILSCLYGMYLRISELTSTPKHSPTMGDFFKDSEGNWWFKTVGKGNKLRQIALSNEMLEALARYRVNYLKLSPIPTPSEATPLVGHLKNPHRPITCDRPIRKLVQECFDGAANEMEAQGDQEAAQNLRVATVHWLRHTGISEDVKHRPREHVRDDAGHGSSAITDRYIDIELKERAKSAKNKKIS